MPTKSIMKTIELKKKEDVCKFITAIEKAKQIVLKLKNKKG